MVGDHAASSPQGRVVRVASAVLPYLGAAYADIFVRVITAPQATSFSAMRS